MKKVGLFLTFITAFVLLSITFILKTPKMNQIQTPIKEVENSQVNSAEVKGAKISISPSLIATPTAVVKAALKSNRSVYLGMWTQGFWDPSSKTLHPEALIALENKIGKDVAIAHYYLGWEELESEKVITDLRTISSHGWRPMISVNPYFFAKCPANGLPLYKAIASGNCDEFIKNVGKNLKQFGKTLLLRFAWEMNIPSMEWQIEKTGSSNEDFIHAWQRMHQIIHEQNASNVLWVFSPDVGNTYYKDIYPGDGYVDWIGLDGYNWGTTQSWSRWQTFTEVFSTAYRAITALAPNKPLMISEVNSTDKGGDKSMWYQDMLQRQIPLNFPKIKAVVFYNEDRSVKEGVNWLIDISQDSLDSFSKNIQNPVYLSSF